MIIAGGGRFVGRTEQIRRIEQQRERMRVHEQIQRVHGMRPVSAQTPGRAGEPAKTPQTYAGQEDQRHTHAAAVECAEEVTSHDFYETDK